MFVASTSQGVRIASALCALFAFVALGCHNLDFSSRYGSSEIGIFDDLFSVSVVDDESVVAVGYQGAVYYTRDGGDTWKKGQVPSNKLLYSVSMADADVGWAVGQLGTILRTEDGGRTWTLQDNLKIGEGTHLFGVHAIDRDTALAVGEWGGRIRTEDGGKTWTDNSLTVGLTHPQFVWLTFQDQDKVRGGGKVYEDVALQDVTCLRGGARCWIIGEFGYIFWSDDRGREWQRAEILGEVRMDPLVLEYNAVDIDAHHREALAGFAEIIEDETHLNILIDPFMSDREIENLFEKAGRDPSDVFDVISARIDATRFALEDADLMSDRLRMYNKPPWDYEDFLEHDPEFLDRYIDSRRAEQPMLKVSIIQNPFLFTVRFKDRSNGLISGLGGVMLRSTDGGETWSYVETQRKQAVFAVDSSREWSVAVGEKGLVQFSRDGGATWAPPSNGQFPELFTYMRDVGFDPGRETGFIVGQEGKVLRTRDGGNTWQRVLPPEERLSS